MVLPESFVGQMIGMYKIERVIGHGRLSTLYQAVPPPPGPGVALTLFTVAKLLSPTARARFLSRFTYELSSISLLRHPAILAIEDFGEYDEYPFMIVSFGTAESLAQKLQQQMRWTPTSAFPLISCAADALAYAMSRGVVHGSLNPTSLLIQNDRSLQVTGFGLNRLLERHGIEGQQKDTWSHILSVMGTIIGKLEYMAPECVQGQPADAHSDVYALGCILYEMLCGHPPFVGTPLDMLQQHIRMPLPSLESSQPDLPPSEVEQMDAVLQQALHPDPTQRFQFVDEFVEAYQRVIRQYDPGSMVGEAARYSQ